MSEPRSELSLPPALQAVPDPPHDRLDEIFRSQRRLMEKYHEIEGSNGAAIISTDLEGDLDHRKVQARLHELYGYLSRELAEAMAELKNKPWKRTEEFTVREDFIEEVGDALHFFVEFCLTAGLGPEELFDVYQRTHQKNTRRQQDGY